MGGLVVFCWGMHGTSVAVLLGSKQRVPRLEKAGPTHVNQPVGPIAAIVICSGIRAAPHL